MVPNQVVASVNSIKGLAFARGSDGADRPLKAGSPLYDGETLITDPNSSVVVTPDDGSPPFIVPAATQLAMANLPADDAEIDPNTLANMVERFRQGQDLDPPEAGPGAGGGGSRGHNFVMLDRIVETVNPMSAPYGTAVFTGKGPFEWVGLGGGGGNIPGTPPPPPPPDLSDRYETPEGNNGNELVGNVLDNDRAILGNDAVVTKVVVQGVEVIVPANGWSAKIPTELGGFFQIKSDGTFVYTSPAQRYNSGVGTDTDGEDIDVFHYYVKGANGEIGPILVQIEITDTVPVANDDVFDLSQGDLTAGFFSDNVITNPAGKDIQSQDWIRPETDTDPGVWNIVWQVKSDKEGPTDVPVGGVTIQTAMGGTVTINQDGSFKYTPPPGYDGPDSFWYQLNDGDNSPSNWAEVTFNVPPSLGDRYETPEGNNGNELIGNVLDNDKAIVGDDAVVTKVVVQGVEVIVPANGWSAKIPTELGGFFQIKSDGTFVYTSTAQRYNSGVGTDTDGEDIDSFHYYVKGANGEIGPILVQIEITDTMPVAVADNYELSQGDLTAGFFSDNVMTNDIQSQDWLRPETDNDPGLQNVVSQVRTGGEGSDTENVSLDDSATVDTAKGGTVTINPDGSFEYTPKEGFFGEDSFEYRLLDGDGSESEWATVALNVPRFGTDGIEDVFTWHLSDLGNGTEVMHIVKGFNADEGDKLDLRDLLQDGDDYLSHLGVSVSASGNTVIAVTPVEPSAPLLNIVIEGVDLVGNQGGEDAIKNLIDKGNLIVD